MVRNILYMKKIKIIFFFVPKEIRAIVKDLEKSARDILMILQNIHNENNMEENISMCV